MTDTHKTPPRGPSLVVILIIAASTVVALIAGIALGPSVKDWADARRAAEVSKQSESGTWYISQMHPWIIQPEPGQCPICGMDLTPVDPDRFAGEIAIDPVIVQNMGVRTARAEQGTLSRSLRTVGTVQVDEGLVNDVVQRFGGWIEQVHVQARWDRVSIGDPLFSMYAPSVAVAEEEYLIAKRQKSGDTQVALLRAARSKLERLGIDEQEIDRLEREETVRSTITVFSPINGYVWQKNINVGSEIAAKTVAFRLVDLSRVWVEASIYEHQLPFVSIGQGARVRLDYGEQQELPGSVAHIYPAVDVRTREARARFVFDNDMTVNGPRLRPGMYATVFLETQLAEDAVVIPREAVIGTGKRKVVFVSLGRGKFEPRTVQLGPSGDGDLIAIQDGIAAGEQVVTSGQFLLDSESKMREALAKVMKGDLASEQLPAADSNRALTTLGSAARTAWDDLVRVYLDLQEQLYEENGNYATAVAAVQKRANHFVTTARAEDEHMHHRIAAIGRLANEAQALEHDVDSLRPTFGALSITINELLNTFGQAHDGEPLLGFRCGMADGVPDLGVWLQRGTDVRNPYFGTASSMRDCAADEWGVPVMGKPLVMEVPITETHAQHKATPSALQLSTDFLRAYNTVQQALYNNDLSAAQQAGPALQETLVTSGIEDRHDGHIIAAASDLKTARIAFGALSLALKGMLEAGSEQDGLIIYRCGMARGIPDKGVWIQSADGEAENPYFGIEHGMADCYVEAWRVNRDGISEAE